MFAAITNPVSNAFRAVADVTVNAGTQVCNFGGRLVGSVTPALSAVVAKIKSINVLGFLNSAAQALKSKVGVSAVLIGGAAALFYASNSQDNHVVKYALRAAGIAAFACSAFVAFSPVNVVRI